jgi:hypothetical protein
MVVGCLNEGIPADILDLGFKIVTEIKCLGIIVNNKAENLERHFDGTVGKIRQLIGSWERYNLSLPGRIGIAKTMLISQIGYIGCIVTPTEEQFRILQDLIDGYVIRGIVVSKDRLYTKPKAGGLGLINLKSYVAALQCSWIKRCSYKINDPWRWMLASACRFNLDILRPGLVSKNDHPILWNILESFIKLTDSFYRLNENYSNALLVNNQMFLRAPPERRAPVRGAVDRNLLGHGFFDNNKERLLALKMNCLVTQGRVVSFITLRLNTGLPFDAVTYMNLVTAGNFAIKKYANKNGSDGTCNSISWLLNQVRRGSKRFRRTMEKNVISKVISELRVVNTFFDIIQVEKPDSFTLSILYSSWSWTFLSNRFRTFCFQYVNNSLGIKTRIAARYRNRNVVLDDSCTFCLKKNVRNPSRETFMHLFYECPCIIMLRQRILEIFFPHSE